MLTSISSRCGLSFISTHLSYKLLKFAVKIKFFSWLKLQKRQIKVRYSTLLFLVILWTGTDFSYTAHYP